MNNDSTFLEFAKRMQNISELREKQEKIEYLKSYLISLNSLESQKLALRFIFEGAFSSQSQQKITIGNQSIAKAAARFLEMDYDYVFLSCKKAVGDVPETIEKLMEAWPIGINKRNPKPILLSQIASFFDDVAVLKSTSLKEKRLHEKWQNLTGIEIKFLLRIMQSSALETGLTENEILEILSDVFKKPISLILFAHSLTHSIEETVQNCAENTLESVRFSYFRPLDFMQSSVSQSLNSIELKSYFCEESFDGKRCQVHIYNKEVRLFSSELKDISSAFPSVCSFFLEKNLENMILDGVLVTQENDIILPFKTSTDSNVFIAFDLVAHQTELLTSQAFSKRRNKLEIMAKKFIFPISVLHKIDSEQELTNRLNWAIKHGNKGLILKKDDSKYSFGIQKQTWLKLNQSPKSLICALLYAHANNGNRAEMYSDLTLGIKSQENPEYYIPICKINNGFILDEIKQINSELKSLTTDKFGPTLGLKPKIIIEIEFDEVHENKRTKAGFGLKNAQFKAIRDDLELKDVQTQEELKTVFEAQKNQARIGNSVEPFMLYL